jgi:DUF2892 family protein
LLAGGLALTFEKYYLLKLKIMKKNMGTTDRVIRVLLAVVFFILYFTGIVTGGFGFLLLVVGFVFVATSAVSLCPLYSLLGFSSCPIDTKKTN